MCVENVLVVATLPFYVDEHVLKGNMSPSPFNFLRSALQSPSRGMLFNAHLDTRTAFVYIVNHML